MEDRLHLQAQIGRDDVHLREWTFSVEKPQTTIGIKSAGLATPSSSSLTPAIGVAWSRRLIAKPGTPLIASGVLPMPRSQPLTPTATSGAVSKPTTTSTIRATGQHARIRSRGLRVGDAMADALLVVHGPRALLDAWPAPATGG